MDTVAATTTKKLLKLPNAALVTVASLSGRWKRVTLKGANMPACLAEEKRCCIPRNKRERNREKKMHPCGDRRTKDYCTPVQAGEATVCLNIKTPGKVFSHSF